MKTLLQTAYWPCLSYMKHVITSEGVVIEQHERYEGQGYRNRTRIMTANGVMDLSVPVSRAAGVCVRDAKIFNQEKWQHRHWRAIESAYGKSPYFTFFRDDIAPFYEDRFESLLEFNTRQLKVIAKILRIKTDITFTGKYERVVKEYEDHRNIHPRKHGNTVMPVYYQTFSHKHPFAHDLSILDLLFNTGLGTLDYLRSL